MDRKELTVSAFGMRVQGTTAQFVIDATEGGNEVIYTITVAADQARAIARVGMALAQITATPAPAAVPGMAAAGPAG
jgi:hypothetical protein